MARKIVKKKATVKKKKWVTVHATRPYERYPVGETYCVTPEEKVGTKLHVSLTALTGEHSKQNPQLKFIISRHEDGKLYADLMGMKFLQSALKKLVRRNRDKLDLSFTVTTKDEKKVRVKVLVTTRFHTTGVVLTKLSKRIMHFVIKTCSEHNYADIAAHIINKKFQRLLQQTLKKTYPVHVCEVRSFEVDMNTHHDLVEGAAASPQPLPEPKELPRKKRPFKRRDERTTEHSAPAKTEKKVKKEKPVAPAPETKPEPVPEPSAKDSDDFGDEKE